MLQFWISRKLNPTYPTIKTYINTNDKQLLLEEELKAAPNNPLDNTQLKSTFKSITK